MAEQTKLIVEVKQGADIQPGVHTVTYLNSVQKVMHSKFSNTDEERLIHYFVLDANGVKIQLSFITGKVASQGYKLGKLVQALGYDFKSGKPCDLMQYEGKDIKAFVAKDDKNFWRIKEIM